ncbi:diguanylate cyclase [Aquabacterium fontiphilum]|uniref:GGDEF domain-containing protein n=1 Tax=Aquabacterium fontiphilum TaxID=450365 RepID=UPI001377762E|nr:diguanylate cyclase [Aquabacterium fontiphilum]NBD19219.1 diguanylate cyclase [Aquabacterium fontiphilum]
MPQELSRSDVESLTRHHRWLEPVPAALQLRHAALRQREFTRLVAVWWPLLLAAFVAFIGFTVWLYAGELHGRDRVVFAASELVSVTAGMIGLALAFRPGWQASHERWLPWTFGTIVAAKLAAATLMTSRSLAVNEVHMAVLVTIVGALGLHLGVRAVARGCAIGALGLLAAWWSPTPEAAWLAGGHYGLTAAVCLFVAAVRQDKDRMAFYQSVLLDMERQEVQRLNQELGELARRDGLTGLANRRAFDEALALEWDRARRTGRPLALLMVDVDHFKAYNDHFGHPAGDTCLVRLAEALSAVVRRPGDQAARYGGEEFTVLLPDTDEAGAEATARRLTEEVDRLALPHPKSSAGRHVSVSIGVAVARPDGQMARDNLVDRADAALYAAKHGGRHRHVLWSEADAPPVR